MGFWAFFADVLADLKFAKTVNDQRADNQSSKKCGEAGESCAESKVTKNTKRRKIMEKFQVQQPIEQSASG